jgi:choline dehydrogenase-like flavoprotein
MRHMCDGRAGSSTAPTEGLTVMPRSRISRRRVLAIAAGSLAASATSTAAPASRRDPAPRRRSASPRSSCDFLIVGAGSAGCVLARRLAECGMRVTLLEAGGPDGAPELQDPRAWPALQGSRYDWKYATTPQRHTLGRVHAWARGKVLGGSSTINAMAHHRGHASRYDAWAQSGASGWSYADLLPYFRKLETFALGASEFHGGEGPIYVDVPRGEAAHPAARQFIAAGEAAGFAPAIDINGAQVEGPTWNHVALKGAQRQSTSECYLRPALQLPTAPRVITSAVAQRLLFEGRRSIGVEYSDGRRLRRIRAEREVVLATGAIESPKLLMLSGIGAPGELERFGIPIRQALPGVGQNLQDHLLGAGNVYEAARPLPVSNYQHGEGMHYLRTRAALAAPDILLMFVTVPFASPVLAPPPGNAYTILPCIMQPQSRGTIRLRSANVADAPVIDPHYFEATEDVETMARGFDIAREIGSQPALAEWRRREVYPSNDWADPSGRDRFVRQAASTFFHPVGTCAMGTGAEAVVDAQLRVLGTDGLRVIDASVMPIIPAAPTHAAVIAIAEKAADLLLSA